MPQDIKFAVCLLIPMLLLSWELSNGQENRTYNNGLCRDYYTAYVGTTIRIHGKSLKGHIGPHLSSFPDRQDIPEPWVQLP